MKNFSMMSIACLLGFSVGVDAMDIWGKGEVARITDAKHVPQNLEEIWKGYNASYDKHNPLEAKIHKTWEADNGAIVVNWVQLTVGTFQGKKTIVCGYFAYPKGAKKLPGIVMFHGGPQTASEQGALKWARLGYVVFHPNHNSKVSMGGEAQGLPNTDWGSIDGWGAKGPDGPFQAGEMTIDAVPSPRNNWQFIRQMSGRRIITFLTKQPQVDHAKIGVRGHSTGGVLATCVSLDPRIAAAVPSVGGTGGFMDKHPIITGNTRHLRLEGARRKLFDETLEMKYYWKHMHAPTLFLSASNDFNSPDWNSIEAIKLAKVDTRFTSCANYNHAFPPETMIADYLWFQDKLKGEFAYPKAPKAELLLDTKNSVPVVKVTPPNTSLKLKRVEIFYTDGRNPLTRFWITPEVTQQSDGTWTASCEVIYNDEPLTAFANVIYEIDPIKAPNHSYNGLSELGATSNYAIAWPDDLQKAGIKGKPAENRLIDDFSAGLRDWTGSLKNGHHWSINTRKVSDVRFMGPQGAELVFEVNSPEADQHMGMIISRNYMEANFREHVFYRFIHLPKKGWNTVRIKTGDLKNPFGWKLDDWHKISSIELCSAIRLKHQIETNYAARAKDVSSKSSKYQADLGELPTKVSGWNEKYYEEAGDEYTKDNMVSKEDALARSRFRNMRWEGGKYVKRSKPYVKEPYIRPSGEGK